LSRIKNGTPKLNTDKNENDLGGMNGKTYDINKTMAATTLKKNIILLRKLNFFI
jgi:hypothetical protein